MALALAVFLLLLNAFFVAAEFALVKVRATQLEPLVDKNHRTAKIARHIVANIDPYLSATQLGITLASLGLGWVGEPAVVHLLEPAFMWAGITDPAVAHSVAFAVGFTLISFLHIVIGEIAPKSYAIMRPLQATLVVSIPMRICYYLFYPFLVVLNGASNLLLRSLGVNAAGDEHGKHISAEELSHITAASAASGVLPAGQGELLHNVFSFSDRVASEIMVPHTRVFYINADTPPDEVLRRVLESGHSRFPLVDGSLDRVIGVLHIKDLLPLLSENQPTQTLRAIARNPVYVPENMPAQKLLLELQLKRFHLAIVVDEYGGTSGIVTIEDVLEELVGEIQDEFDAEQPLIQPTDFGYAADGSLSLVDLLKVLQINDLESEADTVNGYVLEQLENMPKPGDEVGLHNWKLKVVSLDGLRVGRLEVTPVPHSEIEKA